MPKKTEEKNTKGKKATVKASATKKTTKKPIKKVEKEPVKVEEVITVKEEIKKGKEKELLINNTPFVVSVCIIILLLAILIFVLCTKKVPTTKSGDEIVAKINGKTITADDLYLSLKENYGVNEVLSLIDDHIANKEVTITKKDKEYAQGIVDMYIEYAEYYQTDFASFLAEYLGLTDISTEEEFFEFVLEDYKKTLAVQKYIIEETDEKVLKDYYKENYSDSLTVKHILIEVDKDAKDADKADKEAYDAAVKLIQKLNKTDKKKLDKKFEELAENNSDDTATYSNGGLIEDFTKGEMVDEFWKASVELEDGKYTKEPVKTEYGYHIILKVSTKPVEKFKDIKDDVAKSYAEKQLTDDSTLFNKKWSELRKKYKLSINDDFMKKTYNDQIKELSKEEKTEKTEK